MEWLFWAVTVASAGLAIILLEVAKVIWWKPLHLKKLFEAQGIQGPSYKFIYGNAPDIVRMAREESSDPKSLSGHNIVPRVLPALHQWKKTYGPKYVYWFGNKPRLYVPDPELVREILSNKFGHYKKVHLNPTPMKHRGLGTLEDKKWAQHRRIINPSFHMEVLKGMIPEITECGTNMIEDWRKLVSSGANEINVFKEFSCFTSDVISRTAFGSSYAEGKHVFHLLSQLVLLRFERSRRVNIPGSRCIIDRRSLIPIEVGDGFSMEMSSEGTESEFPMVIADFKQSRMPISDDMIPANSLELEISERDNQMKKTEQFEIEDAHGTAPKLEDYNLIQISDPESPIFAATGDDSKFNQKCNTICIEEASTENHMEKVGAIASHIDMSLMVNRDTASLISGNSERPNKEINVEGVSGKNQKSKQNV
ncbi:cytochrome P450 734A1-like [Cryptomeria japonica]|uniref:cytochrome P450 734A1-like n=1 Tax=Cryptomeria japonica TaxID=3369 RepID=UPI0027D9F345|nr:cytochrome P450 734A1-like [Cryptomeria japonica]